MDIALAIEDERARLGSVDALLHCVVEALNSGERKQEEPDYACVVIIAREMLAESMDALEGLAMKAQPGGAHRLQGSS